MSAGICSHETSIEAGPNWSEWHWCCHVKNFI